LKRNIFAMAGTLLIVAGGLTVAAPSSAAEADPVGSSATFTQAQFQAAVPELTERGVVSGHSVIEGDNVVTKLDLGHGLTVDIAALPSKASRISAGQDGNGVWVKFNTVDQNLVLAGGAWMMGAGICAALGLVSGGVACVIVGAIVTIATAAVSANGGACANSKQLQVWANGSRKPRCI
jgi:hypothetical protein